VEIVDQSEERREGEIVGGEGMEPTPPRRVWRARNRGRWDGERDLYTGMEGRV